MGSLYFTYNLQPPLDFISFSAFLLFYILLTFVDEPKSNTGKSRNNVLIVILHYLGGVANNTYCIPNELSISNWRIVSKGFLEVYDALMQATVKLIDYWAKRKERINGLCNVHLHRNCKPRFQTCSKSLVNYKEKLSKFCGHFANRIISQVYKKAQSQSKISILFKSKPIV